MRRFGWGEAGFAFRLVLAGMGSYAAASMLGLHGPQSAVFSALIVTRPYSDGAWRAAGLRLLATASGILVAFAALWLRTFGLDEYVLLFLALAPLSLLTAWDQSYRTSLITVLIMLSAPAESHVPELDVALGRGAAVALGAVIGSLVSMLVLPQRHEHVVAVQARRVVTMMLTQASLGLQDDSNGWAIERTDREVRKTLMELGQTSRDHGRRAAEENPSARIVGLTRYVQAAFMMLRTEWRRLDPQTRPGRATWVEALAQSFASRADQAALADEVARLRSSAKSLEPTPIEGALMVALLNSLTTLKGLLA